MAQTSLIIGDTNWAVKEDSLLGYNVIQNKYLPIPIDTVRATTATRVNEQGLIEIVPRNLIQQSETFDTTWTKYNSATITNNAIVAPNGTTTADLLIAGSTQEIYSANMPKAAEELFYTFSCYAKIYNTNVFQMVCSDFSTSGTFANFNLSTLTVSLTTGATWSNTSGSIESVGNGWYRCIFRGKSPATLGLYLSLTTTGTNSVSGVYIWGAQVEQGSTVTEYFPTTNRLDIPRIDYSTGSAALLVEPQRTNLLTYSQNLDTNWVKILSSVETNSIISPDGTQNATKLNILVASDYSGLYQVGNSASNKYTMSIFVKKGTKNWFYFVNLSGTNITASFNILNGTLGTVVNGTASITDFGNGWYRCTYSDANNINNNYFQFGFSDADNSYTPTSVGNGYIWGAQLEVGSYPTSYIPTIASTVTRNADAVSKTGISGLIGQTEGVIFLDLYASAKNKDASSFAAWIIAGESSINFQIYNLGTTLYWYARNAGGVLIDQNANQTLVEGQRYKIAFAYKSGDYALYINGVQKRTSTNANVPAVSQFNLSGEGFGASSAIVKNEYNSVQFYKTRLTNSELSQLTTL